MNFVMTSSNRFVEVQGTAEKKPFTVEEMDIMRFMAVTAITRLFEIQRRALP
jgi:ribonuclease PH